MQADRGSLFATLVSASSVVVAILFVAGFSYRWSYYYNFGLKDLVYELSTASILVSALELIRTPSNAATTFLVLFVPLAALQLMIFGGSLLLSWLNGRVPTSRRRLLARARRSWRDVGPGRFVIELVRVLVLVFSALAAGSLAGYRTFLAHVAESRTNPLPTVTAVLAGGSERADLPMLCGAMPTSAAPLLIGDARRIATLREFERTCSTRQRNWRLLHRDARSVYLFATEQIGAAGAGRPLTLVMPNNDKLYLIME